MLKYQLNYLKIIEEIDHTINLNIQLHHLNVTYSNDTDTTERMEETGKSNRKRDSNSETLRYIRYDYYGKHALSYAKVTN